MRNQGSTLAGLVCSTRRMCLAVLLLWQGSAMALPSLENFQQESRQDPGRTFLVIVTQDGCEWCEYVIQHHLDPMHRDIEREKLAKPQLVLRKLDLADDIVDFAGLSVSAGNFVRRYTQSFTPTILIFGPNGKLLTKPLVGVSSRDYYSVYLDQAIQAAMSSEKAPGSAGSE